VDVVGGLRVISQLSLQTEQSPCGSVLSTRVGCAWPNPSETGAGGGVVFAVMVTVIRQSVALFGHVGARSQSVASGKGAVESGPGAMKGVVPMSGGG
jgi:hypothetical protein